MPRWRRKMGCGLPPLAGQAKALACSSALAAMLGGLLPALALAFSQGAPICEVNVLPLVEMSPTLSSPAPQGWLLQVPREAYMADRPLQVRVHHPDPAKRARGVLLWAKSGQFSGAGQFLADTELFQFIPEPADCGLWAVSHRSASPKPLDELRFWWMGPDAGTVILRAFIIEDCEAPEGCRAHQALTPLLALEPRLFFDDFEAVE